MWEFQLAEDKKVSLHLYAAVYGHKNNTFLKNMILFYVLVVLSYAWNGIEKFGKPKN